MPDIPEPQSPSSPSLHELIALHRLILSSDFGSWLWEPETDALYVNEQYVRMLGYSVGSFPQHISAWEDLIHPEEREHVVRTQRSVLTGPTLGDSFESRYRLRNAAGEYVWILGRGFVLHRNAAGLATRVSGMHISIKALEAAMEKEMLQHERMRFALEACCDGLWDWNTENGEVYFSPRYATVLNYTPDSFPQHVSSWVSRVHPDDYSRTVEKQYAHVLIPENGDHFECVYRFLAADNEYKWILGRGKVIRRDATGKATRIVGLHTDITELRNTQEKLTKLLNHDSLTQLYSRYYFDSLLDQLCVADYPVSVIYVDVDGLKLINDYLGHSTGDQLLITAADILRESLPYDATIGRIGGDEFAVLLLNCTAPDAENILQATRQALDAYNADGTRMPVFITLGLVTAEKAIPAHKLMAKADKAMLYNKHNQRRLTHPRLKAWIEKTTGQAVNDTDIRTCL